MKDRLGHEYAELVQLQKAQLKGIWKDRLYPGLFKAVSDYVARENKPASSEKTCHQVYRGYDLIQIIQDWPELKPCYPPAVPVAADDIV